MLPWFVTVQLKSSCAFCSPVWRFRNPVVAEINLRYIDTTISEPPLSEVAQQICRTLHSYTGKIKFSSCLKDNFALLYWEALLFVMWEDIVLFSVGPYEVCNAPYLFCVMLHHVVSFKLAFFVEHNVVFIQRKPTNSHVANNSFILILLSITQCTVSHLLIRFLKHLKCF